MSHLVSEAWHQAETRQFLRSLFESEPNARLVGNFAAYMNGVPQFLPSLAQYSLERAAPLWLVTFYGEPREKHVGAVWSDDEGQYVQVRSIDPSYIDILAVKLSGDVEESEVFGEASREIWKACSYSRVQQKEANIFRFSENGNLIHNTCVNGAAADEPVLVANFCFDGGEFVGRAPDELFHLHSVPKFDPAKPEAAYYRSSMGNVIPISPVTMMPE